ncbi:MAG: flagellar motor protein MotB, partial [Oryzihumus sp.]
MPRAKRRQHEEEHHGNHERWLVTYADMLTLLMVLFIVMFAISQVDQKRFDELKSGMAAGFGQS